MDVVQVSVNPQRLNDAVGKYEHRDQSDEGTSD